MGALIDIAEFVGPFIVTALAADAMSKGHNPSQSTPMSTPADPNGRKQPQCSNPPPEPDQSWGNSDTLDRHFDDHGGDFGAANANEYADMAAQFLQDAIANGYPMKVDAQGVIRAFDPATNTFGSYNPNGTSKTFFKPSSKTYWNRQPGSSPNYCK